MKIEASPLPREAGFPLRSNPRSITVRQNLRGTRSLLRFIHEGCGMPRIRNRIQTVLKAVRVLPGI